MPGSTRTSRPARSGRRAAASVAVAPPMEWADDEVVIAIARIVRRQGGQGVIGGRTAAAVPESRPGLRLVPEPASHSWKRHIDAGRWGAVQQQRGSGRHAAIVASAPFSGIRRY